MPPSAERVALASTFGFALLAALGCGQAAVVAAAASTPAASTTSTVASTPAAGSGGPAEMTTSAAAGPGAASSAPGLAPAASQAAPSPAPPGAARPASPAAPATAPATATAPALATHDPMMDRLLANGGAALKTVMATPQKYRFQVLYGAIGQGTAPALERHGYRVDEEYFFPASSMKVPIVLAAYERLAAQRNAGKPWLTRDATLHIAPASGAGEPFVTTLARETWRALIVSDNLSANRLLGFVGHREAHETLWSFGLASARIHTGFATGGDIDPAEVSPRIEVAVTGGANQELPARRSNLVLPPTDAKNLALGEANLVNGKRVPGAVSFSDKNAMRLRELQDALVRLVRPELLPPPPVAVQTSKEDLASLRQALGTLPSESGLAGFERNVVADYQLSPFLRGVERVRPRGHFEIYSKVGQAFGFLIANAYIVDKDTGRSFFLVASVYANPTETMNDDSNYAYEAISFPALADVAEAFCRHTFTP